MRRSKLIRLSAIVVIAFVAFAFLVPAVHIVTNVGECNPDWWVNRNSNLFERVGYGCSPSNYGYESISLKLLGVGSSYVSYDSGPGQSPAYTLYSWSGFWVIFL